MSATQMKAATAHSLMALHRKQMADAIARKDQLGFDYAAFRHRELMREHAPGMYALWARQNPVMAAQDDQAIKARK